MNKKIFCMECSRRKIQVLLLTLLAVLTVLVLAYLNLYTYVYKYQIDVWEQAGQIFSLLFPLLCMLCAGSMIYEDKRNSFLLYIQVRMPMKEYLASKKAACITVTFLFLFLASFLSAAIIYFLFPKVGGLYQVYQSGNFSHIMGNWYTEHALGYAFILSIWRGMLGGVIVNFGFHLSKYVTNKVVIYVGPFVLVMLLHFVLAIAGIPQYSIIYSFEPSGLVSSAITLWSVLIGPAQFLIFAFLAEIVGRYYENHCVNSPKNLPGSI
ncbi:MAG: hypothetical protein RSD28_09220 [Lachnospiraceae bacterium]